MKYYIHRSFMKQRGFVSGSSRPSHKSFLSALSFFSPQASQTLTQYSEMRKCLLPQHYKAAFSLFPDKYPNSKRGLSVSVMI